MELLKTGGKYCCSYYSRQGDRWQIEKAIKNQTFVLVDYSY